jgi:hypothetical protein
LVAQFKNKYLAKRNGNYLVIGVLVYILKKINGGKGKGSLQLLGLFGPIL